MTSPRDLAAQLTVLVKTFERPRLLRRFYASLRRWYPEVPLVIVDDSAQPLSGASFDAHTEYLTTPFNAGISSGRNSGMARIRTPYFVLCDDDYVFTRATRLERLLHLLTTNQADVAGGHWRNRSGSRSSYHGLLEVCDRNLYVIHDISRHRTAQFDVVDFCHNFFAARTSLARECPWEPRLKLLEHINYFLRLQQRGATVVVADEVTVDHLPARPPRYAAIRLDEKTLDAYRRVFLEIHDLENRVDVWGLNAAPGDGSAQRPDRSLIIELGSDGPDPGAIVRAAARAHAAERLEFILLDRTASQSATTRARQLLTENTAVRLLQFYRPVDIDAAVRVAHRVAGGETVVHHDAALNVLIR